MRREVERPRDGGHDLGHAGHALTRVRVIEGLAVAHRRRAGEVGAGVEQVVDAAQHRRPVRDEVDARHVDALRDPGLVGVVGVGEAQTPVHVRVDDEGSVVGLGLGEGARHPHLKGLGGHAVEGRHRDGEETGLLHRAPVLGPPLVDRRHVGVARHGLAKTAARAHARVGLGVPHHDRELHAGHDRRQRHDDDVVGHRQGRAGADRDRGGHEGVGRPLLRVARRVAVALAPPADRERRVRAGDHGPAVRVDRAVADEAVGDGAVEEVHQVGVAHRGTVAGRRDGDRRVDGPDPHGHVAAGDRSARVGRAGHLLGPVAASATARADGEEVGQRAAAALVVEVRHLNEQVDQTARAQGVDREVGGVTRREVHDVAAHQRALVARPRRAGVGVELPVVERGAVDAHLHGQRRAVERHGESVHLDVVDEHLDVEVARVAAARPADGHVGRDRHRDAVAHDHRRHGHRARARDALGLHLGRLVGVDGEVEQRRVGVPRDAVGRVGEVERVAVLGRAEGERVLTVVEREVGVGPVDESVADGGGHGAVRRRRAGVSSGHAVDDDVPVAALAALVSDGAQADRHQDVAVASRGPRPSLDVHERTLLVGVSLARLDKSQTVSLKRSRLSTPRMLPRRIDAN